MTLALGACGRLSEAKATGEKAVASFHAAYNRGEIGDIWKNADPRFQAAATKTKFEDLLEALQRKLGPVVSTSNNTWQVQSYNLNTSILLSQTTMFEHGQGTEAFVFALHGTNATLLKYDIDSTDLLRK